MKYCFSVTFFAIYVIDPDLHRRIQSLGTVLDPRYYRVA